MTSTTAVTDGNDAASPPGPNGTLLSLPPCLRLLSFDSASMGSKQPRAMHDRNENNNNTFFFNKQQVYKHTQPQTREILSTLLSTPPASDFKIDNKIFGKKKFLSKISKK